MLPLLQCQDSEGCALWAKNLADQMAKRLPRAEQLHEEFLARLNRKPASSRWITWVHANQRQVLRAVGALELDTVITCGYPIEAIFWNEGGRIVLRGDTEAGRPLIVVCEFVCPNPAKMWVWGVVTSYDPRTESWRWSPDFEQRVCRCHPHVDSLRF